MQVAEGGSRFSRSGQGEAEVVRTKEPEQQGGRKHGSLAEAHVSRRGKPGATAKCPPPRRPRPSGTPHPDQWAWPMWGRGLRTGAAPARPFRRFCRRTCGSAEGRACALSAFLPTSGCRLHGYLQPGTPCDHQPFAR